MEAAGPPLRREGPGQGEARRLREVDEGGREVVADHAAGEHQGILALAFRRGLDEAGEGGLVGAKAGAASAVAQERPAAPREAMAAERVERLSGVVAPSGSSTWFSSRKVT